MRGRAARSSCSCSTTSRGLGVSDLRPSKLTEPEPERDSAAGRFLAAGRKGP
jgi:hypothetical protein